MGTQKVKEEKPVEKTEKKDKKPEAAQITARKWKGKDWFTVIAPETFGSKELGDVPATDPESLINRKLETSLSDITGNPAKYYVKLNFKINSVKGDKAYTSFSGMKIIKEQLFRIVRKRTSRVEIVQDVTTKDGWVLHLNVLAILNRASQIEIQGKVRKRAITFLQDFASKSTAADFIKTACDDLVQKNIKKFGSKIYPVRFCEIVRIDVKKEGK